MIHNILRNYYFKLRHALFKLILKVLFSLKLLFYMLILLKSVPSINCEFNIAL